MSTGLVQSTGETIRATRDADLLGFEKLNDAALRGLFAEVCMQPVESDGLVFDPVTIRVDTIRVEDPYGGQRVRLQARLGSARIRLVDTVRASDSFRSLRLHLRSYHDCAG